MALPEYVVWFRGRPACPCMVEWIPAYESVLIARGAIRECVDIAQLIGDAPASAGVHSKGGAIDIWQHEPVFQEVAREMGGAAWNRVWPDNEHTHIGLKDCPHNGPVAYQIAALADGYDGTGYLGRGAPDYGPGPRDLRTWREGIQWARQQEDDMPYTEKQLTAIMRGAVAAELDPLKAALKRRDDRLRALIKRKFKATDTDVDAILAELAQDEG